MKKFTVLGIAIALCTVAAMAVSQSQEQPAEPELSSQQKWLKQLVGEWDVKFKIHMEPGQPPMESAGTDSVRALGDNWIVAEMKSSMMGTPYSGILSLGYDSQRKRFNGTWIDSFGGHMWVYKGTLNDAGDTLTLETEGPSIQGLDKTARYKEVIRITGEDSRTFTSSTETEDGEWLTIVTIEYRRTSQAPQNQSALDAPKAINLHYLEIVTSETDAMCNSLEQMHSVGFSKPLAELGNARTAQLSNGAQIGVRAPMGEEQPVVRPYVLVDDIHAAVKAAEEAGAEVLMPPTEIPGQGSFSIYYLGKIEHGLWQEP